MRNIRLNKRYLIIIGGLLVIFALWTQFRPELLFVGHDVDEPLPTTSSIAP